MQVPKASQRSPRTGWYRYAVPAAIFIPFAASLIVFRIQQYGTSVRVPMVSLFAVAPVLVFVPLALFGVFLLNRMQRDFKRSNDEIQINTQRFSSVVSSAMDAIITLDQDQLVIGWNKAAEQAFGCPAAEVLGKPLDRFLPSGFRELHHQQVRQFGESGVTSRSMESPGVLTALRANGEEFPIEATISKVQVGGQSQYTAILRDITERVRAEEVLRESEARFRSIYEQAAVGIEQAALDGRLLMVNAAHCRMLGYEEGELLDRNIEEITHPEDHALEAKLIHQHRHKPRHSFELEKRYRHRDGSFVWSHVTSTVVNGPAGEPLYRISVVQNLTERKRVEEQLKQAQKMEAIGRLAGGVAHDFNTLLNVMLGYSELLLAEMSVDDPRTESVLAIKNAGDAGALLTKQLLAFSRGHAMTQQVLDLREVVSGMAPILGRLLRDDIELTVKRSEGPCLIKADPGQIQQLVLNLVANAGDAMPDGGRITIEVRDAQPDEVHLQQHPTLKPGRYALLVISDSGAGMSAETVAHIFEPFFTTKESGKGTGLGLATVYGIAKRNGGDVWVYSEPGSGTIFKVFLPLCAESVQKPKPFRNEVVNIESGGETILLVEDSAALRELTRVILVRNGYTVLEAEDGVAALEVSRGFEGEIDLMLTDVVMPRMRGPVLAEQMLKERPSIAVVFLSGYTEEVIANAHAGIYLVEKPYTADTLLDTIRTALHEHASGRDELGA